MKLCEVFNTLDELKIDNEQGLGAVPDNQNIDYKGLRVQMKPSMFLKLAHRLEQPTSVDHIIGHIKQGGAVGAPFLTIDIPRDWWDGKFTGIAQVTGHEGRNRMMAAMKAEGDNPVEVHLFFRGEVRARHLTPEIIKALNGTLKSQDGQIVIGPIFHTDAVKETVQLNELFKNTYPFEPGDDIDQWVFTTDSGQQYVVVTLDERYYENRKFYPAIMLEFGIVKGRDDIKTTVTGSGDAFKVFATVAEILKQAIANSGVEYVMFGASLQEPSRIKLYDSFLKLLPKFLPGWRVHETEMHHNMGQKQYVLKKGKK